MHSNLINFRITFLMLLSNIKKFFKKGFIPWIKNINKYDNK